MQVKRVAGVRQLKHGYPVAICSIAKEFPQAIYGKIANFAALPHWCNLDPSLQFCSVYRKKQGYQLCCLGQPSRETGAALRGFLLNALRMVGQQAGQVNTPALSADGNTAVPLAELSGQADFCRFAGTHLEFPPKGVQEPPFSGSSEVSSELKSLCEEGQLDCALHVLVLMDQEGTVPSVPMYRSLLKACAKKKALAEAKRVYAHFFKHGLESVRSLGEDMLSTLVKCGELEGAVHIFYQLPNRTVFAWTAIISGYAMCGQAQEALRMYNQMKQDGVQPNKYTYVSLVKACGSLSDLDSGKRIHAEASNSRFEADVFVGTALINMYGKCGSILDARNVFDSLRGRNVVSWNAMLAAYVQQGHAEAALQLYKQMCKEGSSPDAQTFVSVVQACGMLAEKELVIEGRCSGSQFLLQGKAIHCDARRRGYDTNLFVGNTLVNMYGKCGSIVDAQSVFDGLSKRNVVSWTVMLAAYAQQVQAEKAMQLYEQMCEEGVSPDTHAFVCTLQACAMLAEKEECIDLDGKSTRVETLGLGRILHANARRKGYDSHVFVGNSLVSMYGKCGSIIDAQDVFDCIVQHDVVSWNALIAAYIEQAQADKVLQLYAEMQGEGIVPDDRTFVHVIQACAMAAEEEEDVDVEGQSIKVTSMGLGKSLHAEAWRMRHSTHLFVGNSLVSMYGKCGSTADAESVFVGLCFRDVVSWTSMAAAYVQVGQADKALQLYEQLREDGVTPNDVTFVVAVQACGVLADKEADLAIHGQSSKVECLQKGKAMHADARMKGYDSDVYVGSVLIHMYGKCGSIVDAEKVFHGLPHHTVVSWNAMLTAHIHQDQGEKVLQLYRRMQEVGVSPNEVTSLCILQVCSDTGGLDVCRQVHHNLVSMKKELTPLVTTALIHVYGRCSSMVDAQMVFDARRGADLVAWNALIAGYAREGSFTTCLQCYETMLVAGVRPNGVTFLILLSACSHGGLVDRGVEYFESMARDHGITPHIEHYVSVVDLLSRAGYFTEVDNFVSTMPVQPNIAMWLCLLGACRKHGKVSRGEQAFEGALRLDPKNASAYLLMSNIYADAGLVDHAKDVNEFGHKEAGWKKPGQSWIEHEQGAHTFVVRDQKHPQQKLLYDFLRKLTLTSGGRLYVTC